ncbi:MAG: 5-(carboxyamino)imidazole ribonucleotide synthase [Rhizobiaceae bacterium]
MSALQPGSTVGILGGGQLARMLALAAARLGYRVHVYDPDSNAPAAQVANRHFISGYDNHHALREFAAGCDVVTYEFENVPVEAARLIETSAPVRPGPRALEAAQDRLVEKTFLNKAGIETAPFSAVSNDEDLKAALAAFDGNGVLKTRRMGYDGKGQHLFRNAGHGECDGIFQAMGAVPLILEGYVPFVREISVIAVRGIDGKFAAFDPAENVHRSGILHTSAVPASVSSQTAEAAKSAARSIMNELDYVGIIGIEFFVLEDGSLLANEMAPRVHNSGHWTEAACIVSQFEQHVRAITGLPLGDPARHHDCVMENLIGDDIGRIESLCAQSAVVVHHYGKVEARPGRKMGHFTRLGAAKS